MRTSRLLRPTPTGFDHSAAGREGHLLRDRTIEDIGIYRVVLMGATTAWQFGPVQLADTNLVGVV